MTLVTRFARSAEGLGDLSPLFRAKSHPPVLPDPLLPRPRLIAALRHARRRRVTTIHSPAGSGKSTILAMFQRASDGPGGWYAVDELDCDAGALLYGLDTAISLALDHRPELPRAADRSTGLARVVAGLEEMGARGALIVDDVHRLNAPDAVRALADLIRYLPRGCHLVLAGRELPSGLAPVLDWCAAHRQLAAFTWSDLRLSDEEQSAASALFGKDGPEPWILAWSAEPDWDIAEYIRREIVASLGSDIAQLLARLAVLPGFDAPLAAALSNRSREEIQGLLERLSRAIPLVNRGEDGGYRFGEAGREVLLDLLDGDARRDAYLRVGFALRATDPVRSAEYFVRAEDSAEAARSLAKVPLFDWVSQSPKPAHQVLATLDPDHAGCFPVLRLARAWSEYGWNGQVAAALHLLEAGGLLDDTPADASLAFWAHYVAGRSRVALGEVASARADLATMRGLAQILRMDQSADISLVGRSFVALATIEGILGDVGASRQTAELGLALVAMEPEKCRDERALLHHVAGNCWYLEGDYDRAEDSFQAARREIEGLTRPVQQAALAHPLAGIARHRGEYTRALAILDMPLRLAGLPVRERALLTLQTGHVLLDLGDFRGAGQHYRTVASWFRQPDRDNCFSRSLAGLAICYCRLGLTREADATIALLQEHSGGALGYDLMLAQGIRSLGRREFREAADYFATAQGTPGTLGGTRDAWQAGLLRVQALLGCGDDAEAERVLRGLVAESDGRPAPAVAAWVSETARPLLHRIERDVGHATGVASGAGRTGRQISSLRHAVAVARRVEPGERRPIELHLFGPPQLLIDGQSQVWPRGLRHKAIELFWYAALNPDGFSREQALASLFPDRDEQRGSDVLQSSITDLRRALGTVLPTAGERVLARDDRGTYRLALDQAASSLRCDTRVLADLASQLRLARRQLPPAELPDLFRGELLAGLAAEWLEPARRYWMSVYLRTIATLASRYAAHGELQNAIRCHELALAIDPTLTSAHVSLMRLFHAAGDHQALEAQMWQYRRVARDELGLSADARVQEIYDQLVAR